MQVGERPRRRGGGAARLVGEHGHGRVVGERRDLRPREEHRVAVRARPDALRNGGIERERRQHNLQVERIRLLETERHVLLETQRHVKAERQPRASRAVVARRAGHDTAQRGRRLRVGLCARYDELDAAHGLLEGLALGKGRVHGLEQQKRPEVRRQPRAQPLQRDGVRVGRVAGGLERGLEQRQQMEEAPAGDLAKLEHGLGWDDEAGPRCQQQFIPR